jgi:hypothetical protein
MKQQLICILLVIAVFGGTVVRAQQPADSMISNRLLAGIDEKISKTGNLLDKQTAKWLRRIEKSEANLQKRTGKTDSVAAKKIFSQTLSRVKSIQESINAKAFVLGKSPLHDYLPGLDSLNACLGFLNNNPQLLKSKEAFATALKNFNSLKARLKTTEDLKAYIKDRQAYLNELLRHYDLKKYLGRYNKSVNGYLQCIADIKATLNDAAKMEQLVLQQLKRLPAFARFMSENSFLQGLFAQPGGMTANNSLFQNRNAVNSLLQQRAVGGGANAATMLQNATAAARQQLSQLRQRLAAHSGVLNTTDFEPVGAKKKTLLQKLEYGVNLQFDKRKDFFPVTSNMAVQVGYKPNVKSVIGAGFNYKMGLGQGWQKISITHEGCGFRGYLKWSIKGNWNVYGGYEQNHLRAFENYRTLFAGANPWQKSGLVGITKTMKPVRKVKAEVQLLYDFLNYRTFGTGKPLVLRFGYVINR